MFLAVLAVSVNHECQTSTVLRKGVQNLGQRSRQPGSDLNHLSLERHPQTTVLNSTGVHSSFKKGTLFAAMKSTCRYKKKHAFSIFRVEMSCQFSRTRPQPPISTCGVKPKTTDHTSAGILSGTNLTIFHFPYYIAKILRLVRKIVKSDHQLRHVCLSVDPFFRLSAWKNSADTRRIIMKFDIWILFENISRKITFHQNRTKIHFWSYSLSSS